jgi:hypothetical protein
VFAENAEVRLGFAVAGQPKAAASTYDVIRFPGQKFLPQ